MTQGNSRNPASCPASLFVCKDIVSVKTHSGDENKSRFLYPAGVICR